MAVLGADGFIGSHVVRSALAAGARVTAVCVNEPWRLRGLDRAELEVVRVPGGRWWVQDYMVELKRALARADSLILLAYEPPPAEGNWKARHDHEHAINATGAARVGILTSAMGLHLVFASSADVYGPTHVESVSEEAVPAPVTPYAAGKLEAEHVLAEHLGEALVCFRISTVYGPLENGPRAIPSFIRALGSGYRPTVHGDGRDVRDYVHVGDVAATMVNACCSRGEALPVTINVGSGVGRSTLEVLHAVQDVLDTDRQPLYEPNSRPPSRLILDTRRARKFFGLEPRTDFQASIREEASWILARRVKPPVR